MKSKRIFSTFGVLGIFLAVSLYFRSTSQNTTAPIGKPAVSEMANHDENESKLPIAIVLYDRVNFESIENEKDVLILNSGDFLRLVEASIDKPGVFKMQNKIGRTGWVAGSQFILIPSLTDMKSFYYSTAPLTTLFKDQSKADVGQRI